MSWLRPPSRAARRQRRPTKSGSSSLKALSVWKVLSARVTENRAPSVTERPVSRTS